MKPREIPVPCDPRGAGYLSRRAFLGASGALGKFSKTDLSEGGSKAPAVSVEVRDHTLLAGLAFYPTPRGLPLN